MDGWTEGGIFVVCGRIVSFAVCFYEGCDACTRGCCHLSLMHASHTAGTQEGERSTHGPTPYTHTHTHITDRP